MFHIKLQIISGMHASDDSFLNTRMLSIFREQRHWKGYVLILEQYIIEHPTTDTNKSFG